MAWKSQRSKALDLAMQQTEVTAQQAAAMRAEIVALHQELAALHRELARRDIELIDAMARVASVTDQVRVQNEQDREHQDRIDRAIELLTIVVANTAAPALVEPDGAVGTDVEIAPEAGPTVIGGTVDPSLAEAPPVPGAAVIDLTGTETRRT